MPRKITAKQLARAVEKAPAKIRREAGAFIVKGMAEYKKVSTQGTPWRVGQSGGAIPRASGKLREHHETKVRGLEGRYGVSTANVRYARYVHKGTRHLEARPWLDYAQQKADPKVRKHYNTFLDNIFKSIAR